VRTISWSDSNGGSINLLDQTKLPSQIEELIISNPSDLVAAIQRLSVRGAPALGVAGALGVALILHRAESHNWKNEEISKAISELRSARPTAVNLAWGVDQVTPLVTDGASAVLKRALEIAADDARACREMGRIGADYLINKLGNRKLRILTHCNTGALATTEWGTALGVVQELHSRGLIEEVFADGAAASALFAGLIDAVLIGADRIAKNGDSANKIGSLAVAVAAYEAKVPFLVVAPESTVDRKVATGAEIEIEFRSDDEVTNFAGVRTAPLGALTYNPAFDVTPARYIAAVVTEKEVYEVSKGISL
jgi:methylthioribose-1-phosphate isomerase